MRDGHRRDAEFTDFVAAGQHRLYRQAVLLTGDAARAQDLVQVTLERVYVAWARVEQPAAFARTTLLRRFLRDRQRASRERELLALADGAREGREPDHALTVIEAMRTLPPRMRAVVLMRYWEGESVARTAEVLAMSEGTVKSTAARALARLRDVLGDAFEERTRHSSQETR